MTETRELYNLAAVHMIRPNGTDNSERDFIAAMNTTLWVIHCHTISVDMKAVRHN